MLYIGSSGTLELAFDSGTFFHHPMGTLIPFDILRGFIFGAAALSKGGVDLPKGQYVAMTIAFPFKFPLENDASQGPTKQCFLLFTILWCRLGLGSGIF